MCFPLIDCHTHTAFSFDSDAPMEVMCRRAVDLGLAAYTVTDHCECELYESEGHGVSARRSFETMKQYQTELQSSATRLLIGVEMAQPLSNLTAAEELVRREYDCIIGSIHSLLPLEDFYFLDYSRYTLQENHTLLENYFAEIYNMVCWGKFDTLAHLTYPLRYMIGEYHVPIVLSRFDDQIREIFKELARTDKALEINTSGLRQKIATLLPDETYVKRFYDLGGKYITIGSDAHNPNDLGKGVVEGMRAAANAGFSHVVYFEQRKPVKVWL